MGGGKLVKVRWQLEAGGAIKKHEAHFELPVYDETDEKRNAPEYYRRTKKHAGPGKNGFGKKNQATTPGMSALNV